MMDNHETDMNPDHHPDSGNDFEDSDSSSDDKHKLTQQVKEQHRQVRIQEEQKFSRTT
jgi:hypothetical protein